MSSQDLANMHPIMLSNMILQQENLQLRSILGDTQKKLDNLREEHDGALKRTIEECKTAQKRNEDEIETLKKNNEKLKTQQKHSDEQIKKLKKENEALRQENESLKQEIKELKAELTKVKDEMTQLQKSIKKMENTHKLKRYRLLLGSVRFNYIESAIQYIFGEKKVKSLRKSLCTFNDIQNADKTNEETTRFKEFAAQFYNDDFEEVLEAFGEGRNEFAHPTTLEDEEDGAPCAEPEDLDSIVDQVYQNKKYKILKEQAKKLISTQDKLAHQLGRSFLQ